MAVFNELPTNNELPTATNNELPTATKSFESPFVGHFPQQGVTNTCHELRKPIVAAILPLPAAILNSEQ